MDEVTVNATPSGERGVWVVTLTVNVPADDAVAAAQWALGALGDLQ